MPIKLSMGFIKNFSRLSALVVFVVGCTKTDINIAAISKELAAPVLKSGGVDSVDFPKTQRYLQFGGECDTRLKNLQVGFKISGTEITFNEVPSSTTYDSSSGEGVTAITTTRVNDIDCADGTFDFILSKSFIYDALGITTDAELESLDVDSIQIIGETILGNSKALVLNINNDDSGSGSGSSNTATQIQLSKFHPYNATSINSCYEIKAISKNSSGLYANLASAATFSLLESGSAVPIYNTWNDCWNLSTANSSTQFTMSTTESHKSLIVRSSSSPSTSTLNLSLISGPTLSLSNAYLAIQYKDNSATSQIRYLEFLQTLLPYNAATNVCYPLKVYLRSFNTNLDNKTDHTAIALTLTSTQSNFEVYSDSNCTTSGSPSIAAGSDYAMFSIKYSSSAGATSSVVPAQISVTGVGNNVDSTPTALTIIEDRHDFLLGITSNITISKILSWASSTMELNRCYPVVVDAANSSNFLITLNAAATLNVSATGSTGSGTYFDFYSDGCYQGPISSSTTWNQGNFRRMIYAIPRSTGTSAISFNTTIAGTSLNASISNIAVADGPSKLIAYNWPSAAISRNTCQELEIQVASSDNTVRSALNAVKLNTVSISSLLIAGLYSDSSCSSVNLLSSGSLIYPSANGRYKIYFKSTASAAATGSIQLGVTGYTSLNANINISN